MLITKRGTMGLYDRRELYLVYDDNGLAATVLAHTGTDAWDTFAAAQQIADPDTARGHYGVYRGGTK